MDYEGLKTIDKALNFIQKARIACQNRNTHLSKRDLVDETTLSAQKKIEELEEWLNDRVREIVKEHPAYEWFSKVKGIGGVNIGKVLGLIDIKRCNTISSLWRYAVGAPIGEEGKRRVEKREKFKELHYNITLKTMCWRLAMSLLRANGKYAEYYRKEKDKLMERFESQGIKIVPAEELPEENGKKVEKIEKGGFISLGHVNNMALRKMIKLFLSHLWLVWRKAEGLPVTEPYAIRFKGHTDFIAPEDMIDE